MELTADACACVCWSPPTQVVEIGLAIADLVLRPASPHAATAADRDGEPAAAAVVVEVHAHDYDEASCDDKWRLLGRTERLVVPFSQERKNQPGAPSSSPDLYDRYAGGVE